MFSSYHGCCGDIDMYQLPEFLQEKMKQKNENSNKLTIKRRKNKTNYKRIKIRQGFGYYNQTIEQSLYN